MLGLKDNHIPFSVSTAVMYDKSIKAIKVKVPDSNEEFLLDPATVRRNDRSAQSVVCMLLVSALFQKFMMSMIMIMKIVIVNKNGTSLTSW